MDVSETPIVITAGGRVTISFTVSNSGNLVINDIGASVTVADAGPGAAVGPLTAACATASLPVGIRTTCTITFTVRLAQIGDQRFDLDLRVTGTASNRQPVVATRSFAFTVGPIRPGRDPSRADGGPSKPSASPTASDD